MVTIVYLKYLVYIICANLLFCCHSEFARHECFMPFVLEGKLHCYRKLTLNHWKESL